MLNTVHNQRGVTLIEIMIGMVIAAILLTMSAPAISDWIQNMRIRNVADSIVGGLQISRAEAVKRNTMVRFQLVDNLESSCALSTERTNWVVSQDDVTVAPNKCKNDPSDTIAPRIIQKYSSAEGSASNIHLLSTNNTLTFNGLGRVPIIAAGSNATINITNPDVDNCLSGSPSGTMRCMRILVSPAGQIRMCDPLFKQASHPQGCP